MTPEERKLLDHVVTLSEENNSILRAIRRSNRWAMFFQVLYWLIIIGISLGVYLYIQPYVEQLLGAYKNVSGTVNKVSGVSTDVSVFGNLMKSLTK